MIQSAKRCLRKTIGSARLTYEELLMVVVEVEMTLNLRPLFLQDLEETLTPSHLLCGHRVLSLPDPVVDGEEAVQSTSRHDVTRRV